jgi:phosphoribosylformimino-5-aminoimidazole carboxamide ribotide isomerase
VSVIDIKDYIQSWSERGLAHFFCTDIEKDGMLSGVNVPLYADLKMTFPQLRLWASGGVSSLEDLILLQKTGVEGVITGKAIYEGNIKLHELKDFA